MVTEMVLKRYLSVHNCKRSRNYTTVKVSNKYYVWRMIWNESKMFRVAILDLYEGAANQGMRCIREILQQFADIQHVDLHIDEFEVRIN